MRALCRSALVALVAAGFLGSPQADAAPVICKKKSGVMIIRDPGCKRKETAVDLTQFGALGPKGDTGDTGASGPLLTVLPSGATLRGPYSWAGHKATGYSPTFVIPLTFPLPSEPSTEVLDIGGGPTANCPGTSDDPQAAPGFVCVYQTRNDGGTSLGIFSEIAEGRFGPTLFADVPDNSDFQFDGTWAATAP